MKIPLLVTKLNESKALLMDLSIGQFVKITVWPTLANNMNPNTYIYLFRAPFKNFDLELNPEVSFKLDPIGYVHYLYSGTLLIGYIIEFVPKIKVAQTSSYLSTVKHSKEALPVKHVLNNEHLSVYKVGDNYMVAMLRPDMIDHLV